MVCTLVDLKRLTSYAVKKSQSMLINPSQVYYAMEVRLANLVHYEEVRIPRKMEHKFCRHRFSAKHLSKGKNTPHDLSLARPVQLTNPASASPRAAKPVSLAHGRMQLHLFPRCDHHHAQFHLASPARTRLARWHYCCICSRRVRVTEYDTSW